MATEPTLIPYLSVADAKAAISWYVEVLDAEPAYDPVVMPDGRIGHAELSIGAGTLYLSDAHPEIGVVAPTPGQYTQSTMLAVSDVDATLARFEASGGRRDREPQDARRERLVWAVDPFGHRWGIHGPIPD